MTGQKGVMTTKNSGTKTKGTKLPNFVPAYFVIGCEAVFSEKGPTMPPSPESSVVDPICLA